MVSMDETRTLTLKFNGREVAAAPLTAGQIKVIQMSTGGGSTDQLIKNETRLFRIIENSLGDAQWSDVLDELALGTLDLPAFHDFLAELIRQSVELLTRKPDPAPVSDPNEPLAPETIEALERKLAELRGE